MQAAFAWGAARLRRMVLGNASHARVLATRLGLTGADYLPLTASGLASSVRVWRGWSPDILAIGDTANNNREFDMLRRILFEQGADLTFGVLDDEFLRVRPTDHAHVSALAGGLDRIGAAADGEGVAGAALRRQIDVFSATLLGAWVGFVEPGTLPRLAVTANDHSPVQLGFIAAMRAAAVPTVYLQHAAVTPDFPPLDFDLSILRDERSLAAYAAAGPVLGAAHLVERAPDTAPAAEPVTISAPASVGLYPSAIFDPAALRVAITALAGNPAVGHVFIKPHPNTLWPDATNDLRLLATDREGRPHVGVCGNSSVVLDLIQRGLPVVQLFALDGLEPDYYGFVREGLTTSVTADDLGRRFWPDAPLPAPRSSSGMTAADLAATIGLLAGSVGASGLDAWARDDPRIPAVAAGLTSDDGRLMLGEWLALKRRIDVRIWPDAGAMSALAVATRQGLRGAERSALSATGGRLAVEIAKIARRAGRDDAAADAVDAALILKPGHAQMLALRAELAAAHGDLEGARADAEAALEADPLTAVAAQVLRTVGAALPDRVADRAEAAVGEVDGDRPLAILTRRAVDILIGHDRLDAAERVLAGSLDRLDPADPAYARFAETYARIAESRGQDALAEERYARFDRTATDRGWGPAFGLGVARTLIERERLEDAAAALAGVEARHGLDSTVFEPTRFQLLLSSDRIGQAYELYRHRPVTEAYRALFGDRYLNIGKNVDAQLEGRRPFFISEAGIGDEIRLCALYEEMLARWGPFTATCEPRLERLFAANWPEIVFVPVARQRRGVTGMETAGRESVPSQLRSLLDDAALARALAAPVVASIYDVLASLRPDRSAFPRRATVLRPFQADRQRWSRAGGGPPRVAVSWRSLMRGTRRDRHYLQARELAPLLPAGAELWVVQPQVDPDELRELGDLGHPIVMPDLDLRDDIEGLAGLLSEMDLAIGPGATVTELAGAVGCPTVLVGRMAGVLWRADDDGGDVWSRAIRIHDARRPTPP